MTLTGTRQWAENNANCCKGCNRDCKYCYAKKKALRFKRTTKDTWKNMVYNPKSERLIRKMKGRIMFPTTHDLPYENLSLWYPFLQGLLMKGNEVLIVSKPEFESIQLICNTLYEYKDKVEFRFTIGTQVEDARKFWEPYAPSMSERIRALRFAFEQGWKTSVSMEPLLTKDPTTIINQVKPWISKESGTIWIGMMNHMSKNDFTPEENGYYLSMLEINSERNIRRIYEQYKDDPAIRWKDSIQDLLGLV